MADVEESAARRRAVGERITEFYVSLGLKRSGFAEILQVPYDRLLSYESGRAEPGSAFWISLKVEYPKADVGYLMTGIATVYVDRPLIPVVEEVTAGDLTVFIDEHKVGETSSFSKDKDLFGLRIKGDSMHPEIEDGDTVICAPHRPFVSGKIYACLLSTGETTVKRVYRRGASYELIPSNEEYESMLIFGEGIQRLFRVVELQRLT